MPPKLSVVTPSFNSIRTIRETIESVRTQDYPNWEHIVMDGGSIDGTVELLKEYPHLKWVSEKDEGHYHAMNKGILQATGEVVSILNADDCYLPGALRAVAESFEAHPDWDALFGDILFIDGKGVEIYRREEACYDYNVLRYSRVVYVIHPTLFVRKAVHDRLGLYQHKRFLNCCDTDFILRLGRERCKVGHLPKIIVAYRIHEHGQTADMRVHQNTMRETSIICAEHGSPEGLRGKGYRFVYRLKRQWQKLIYRGKVDVIPGIWKLHWGKHIKKQTSFTSNIDLDKLKSGS